MSLNEFEDKPTLEQIKEEYGEMIIGIFPALHKYKNEHNASNLQKLCIEVVEFCKSIYASTQNDAERRIFKDILSKLN